MSRGPEAGCSGTLRGPTAGNGTERWRDQTAGSPGPGWGFCPRCLHRWVRLGEVWALTLCMVTWKMQEKVGGTWEVEVTITERPTRTWPGRADRWQVQIPGTTAAPAQTKRGGRLECLVCVRGLGQSCLCLSS